MEPVLAYVIERLDGLSLGFVLSSICLGLTCVALWALSVELEILPEWAESIFLVGCVLPLLRNDLGWESS